MFYYTFFETVWQGRHFSVSLQNFESTSRTRSLETKQTLNSTMINQYLLQILGYHVNFTRLCIMTEFSQPIRVFIVTLIYNIIPYHFVNVRKAMIAVYLQYNGMNVHKNQQLLCKNSFYNYGILHSTKLRQLRTDFYI